MGMANSRKTIGSQSARSPYRPHHARISADRVSASENTLRSSARV